MAQSASELQPLAGTELGSAETPEGPVGVRARSPRQIFWERFKADRLALAGAVLVFLMLALAVLAPVFENIVGHTFDHQFRGQEGEPLGLNDFGTPLGPDTEQNFWFGFDDLGRDLFVRVLYGARVSLKVAIIATGIEVVLGVFFGMLAGFMRGRVDTVISRVIDLVLSFPFLLLGISLGVIFNGGEQLVILIIAMFGWPYIARVVRGQTLSIREAQFVEASYSMGASPRWIMGREILPNLIAPIIIYATLVIPINIVAEASLSFLGVGVKEPTPSWGKMLETAIDYVPYGAAWWLLAFPGAFLFLTVLGFNLLGDGLRDALDPKTAH